jgi:hypothetical protein
MSATGYKFDDSLLSVRLHPLDEDIVEVTYSDLVLRTKTGGDGGSEGESSGSVYAGRLTESFRRKLKWGLDRALRNTSAAQLQTEWESLKRGNGAPTATSRLRSFLSECTQPTADDFGPMNGGAGKGKGIDSDIHGKDAESSTNKTPGTVPFRNLSVRPSHFTRARELDDVPSGWTSCQVDYSKETKELTFTLPWLMTIVPDPENPAYPGFTLLSDVEPLFVASAVQFVDKVKHEAERVSNTSTSSTQSDPNPLHWAAWFDPKIPITRPGDEYNEVTFVARQFANDHFIASNKPVTPEEQFHPENYSLKPLLQDDVEGITVRVQWYVDEESPSAEAEE